MLWWNLFLNLATFKQTFQALPEGQGVLALAHYSSPTQQTTFLAVAGHDNGHVHLWPDVEHSNGVKNGNRIVLKDLHARGPIFSLACSDCGWLCSGSFDRTATATSLSGAGEVQSSHTLPLHTGWVRHVSLHIPVPRQGDSVMGPFALSVGCNYLNVWAPSLGRPEANAEPPKRLVRLETGPSPDDPTDEPFRRHDILCADVSDDGSIIAAGLVDGSLRFWEANWPKWWADEQPRDYDRYTGACGSSSSSSSSSGSSSSSKDEVPLASIARAHEGRVVGIHAIPGTRGMDWVTVARNGQWRFWRRRIGSTFKLIKSGAVEGAVLSTGPCLNRSHETTPSLRQGSRSGGVWSIALGTSRGKLYELDAHGTVRCLVHPLESSEAISAVTWVPAGTEADPCRSLIFAGTPSGSVNVYSKS